MAGMDGAGRGDLDQDWTPQAVQRLRARLRLSQAELAARVGTRQQTISEWETGTRAPRRMSRRLLRLVAEEAGVYDVTPAHPERPEPEPAGPEPASPEPAGPEPAGTEPGA
jgi:transcriptional regulator with XRE-family HTH domain